MRFLHLALLVVLCACASSPRLSEVHPGMEASEVRSLLGEPEDRQFEGTTERWIYIVDKDRRKVILFRQGRVTSLVNESAGKLEPVLGSSSETSVGVALCTGNNRFGRFVEGGGCNMYGCWQPGGYCNAFGCSAMGFCNERGCPKKVPSFECSQ